MQKSFSIYMTDADEVWKLIAAEGQDEAEARPILMHKEPKQVLIKSLKI